MHDLLDRLSRAVGELTGQFLYYLAERGALRQSPRASQLYRDPKQPAVTRPAELPAALVEPVASILNGIRWSSRDIEAFLGSYLSEPKSNVVFDAPDDPLNEDDFVAQASLHGIRLDRKAALMYNARTYFINGEENPLSGSSKWLSELADRRYLEAKRLVTHSRHPLMTALLHEWYCAGWIRLG